VMAGGRVKAGAVSARSRQATIIRQNRGKNDQRVHAAHGNC
jgi:hypothetical protein